MRARYSPRREGMRPQRLPGGADGGQRPAGEEELEEEGVFVEDEDLVEGGAADFAVGEQNGGVEDGAEQSGNSDAHEQAAVAQEQVGDQEDAAHGHQHQLRSQ